MADENGFVPSGDHLSVPPQAPTATATVKESIAPAPAPEKPKIIKYNREDLPNNGWHFL